MRDIVATIQPEQDEIVRAGADQTICVQGAPGTGKTAVGLHRAAWLLYAFRDRLARSGVLVIGPNRAFLEHIGAVLPALGEVAVGHTTIEELVAVRARCVAPTAPKPLCSKAMPASPRCSGMPCGRQCSRATEALVVPRGVRKWRVPAYEVNEILDELRDRGVRYDAARQMLPQRLAHAVLLQMEGAGDSPDDRVQDTVARSADREEVRRVAVAGARRQGRAVLPAVRRRRAGAPRRGPAQRRRAADPAVGQPASLQGVRPLVARPTPCCSTSSADHIARTPSLGHVVLDEAQDLSPMQLRAVGRRCSTGAATVLGDIAQGTTPWATDSWESSLAHLGKPGSHVEVLDRGFRVPASVIEYAAQLLPHMAAGLGAPVSVRDNPGRLDLVEVDADGPPRLTPRTSSPTSSPSPGRSASSCPTPWSTEVSKALQDKGIDHGVLGQDHGDIDHQVDVVPATVAKGLEFDRVVVVEPAAIAAAEPDERTGLRRLYVVLTRAVSALTVVHASPCRPSSHG